MKQQRNQNDELSQAVAMLKKAVFDISRRVAVWRNYDTYLVTGGLGDI